MKLNKGDLAYHYELDLETGQIKQTTYIVESIEGDLYICYNDRKQLQVYESGINQMEGSVLISSSQMFAEELKVRFKISIQEQINSLDKHYKKEVKRLNLLRDKLDRI